MENYITLFVATLEHLKLVTEQEAEKLDKQLRESTIPSTLREARQVVADVFEKIEKK